MATTGDRIAGTGTSVTRSTGTAWTNPGNITANDGTNASITGGSSGSAYLVASNFGFTIPTGSVIQGITVKFDAAESSTGTESVTAQLQNDAAALIGTTIAQTVSGTGLTVYTYGGTANLWGTGSTLTPAIVNDPNFGVRFWFTTTHNMTVDYVSIAIEYLPPVSGSLSVSETGSDTFASSGDVIVKGSLSASETGADTFSASGTVFTPAITGPFVATETGADTFASTGKVIVEGALAVAETGSDTFTATGDVIVRGSLAASETGADTFASTGKVVIRGALAASETGADTFASTGKVVVSGTLSATEAGADAFDSQGSVTGALVGDLHVTEQGSDTLASTGQVKVQGLLAANEASDTFAAAGKVLVSGALSSSETGSDVMDSQGSTVEGSAVGDLHGYESGADSFAATGKVAVDGALTAAETGSDTFASVGNVLQDAGVFAAVEQGADTLSASGKVVVRGSLAGTEQSDLLSSSGKVLVSGSFAGVELGPDTAQIGNPPKVEVKQQGGGIRRGIGFVPAIEVTVKLKPTPRARASSSSPSSTTTAGAIVKARAPGARAGTAVVIVYECKAPISPRTRSGTAPSLVGFDYAFTIAVPRGFDAGSHYIKPSDQELAPEFYGMRQGTATPAVTTVLNPTDDELMAIIRMVKQRRQQQRSNMFRTFR